MTRLTKSAALLLHSLSGGPVKIDLFPPSSRARLNHLAHAGLVEIGALPGYVALTAQGQQRIVGRVPARAFGPVFGMTPQMLQEVGSMAATAPEYWFSPHLAVAEALERRGYAERFDWTNPMGQPYHRWRPTATGAAILRIVECAGVGPVSPYSIRPTSK